MGRVCMGRVGYVPSLLCAEFVMSRVYHVPSLLCAELSLNPFYEKALKHKSKPRTSKSSALLAHRIYFFSTQNIHAFQKT